MTSDEQAREIVDRLAGGIAIFKAIRGKPAALELITNALRTREAETERRVLLEAAEYIASHGSTFYKPGRIEEWLRARAAQPQEPEKA